MTEREDCAAGGAANNRNRSRGGWSARRVLLLPTRVVPRLRRYVHERRAAEWAALASEPPALVTRRTRNGTLTFHSRDSVIGYHLYVYRHYEADTIERTTRLLRTTGFRVAQRDTLIDVGANIGMTTTAFLLGGAFRRAVAFEPDPANFALLETNIRQNGLSSRVIARNVALGHETGDATLALSPDNFGDHHVRIAGAEWGGAEQERVTRTIRIERLDDTLDAAGVGADSVGLLWMDVQGFEGHVLEGGELTIARRVPVEMEFWPFGMEKAGTPPERFLDQVRRLFGSWVDLRDPVLMRRPVGDAAALFDTYPGPTDFTETLWLPR